MRFSGQLQQVPAKPASRAEGDEGFCLTTICKWTRMNGKASSSNYGPSPAAIFMAIESTSSTSGWRWAATPGRERGRGLAERRMVTEMPRSRPLQLLAVNPDCMTRRADESAANPQIVEATGGP